MENRRVAVSQFSTEIGCFRTEENVTEEETNRERKIWKPGELLFSPLLPSFPLVSCHLSLPPPSSSIPSPLAATSDVRRAIVGNEKDGLKEGKGEK